MLVKILTLIGSVTSIGFGVWHFTVPATWKWYDYIAPSATELVVAVRAINVFFSLCLVLIGIANIIFVLTDSGRLTLAVMLGLSTILWGVRCVMQLIYPQGTASSALQYGMLGAFVLVFLCFLASLIIVLKTHTA